MNREQGQIVLAVRGLTVRVRDGRELLPVVRGLDFDLRAGEVLALVGESGCGKTKTAEAIMGLVTPDTGAVEAERIELDGRNLATLAEAQYRRLRGKEISMVFQDSRGALDPVFTVGGQLVSVIRRHQGLSARRARETAAAMLQRVGFADCGAMLRRYPHELSGGQCQRVGIAMAMACRPRVLIADEPTTALDVTTQAQVLSQLTRLGSDSETGILLITHDLGIVAHYCDRAIVMRGGRAVEEATVDALFYQPCEEYTQNLLAAAREGAA